MRRGDVDGGHEFGACHTEHEEAVVVVATKGLLRRRLGRRAARSERRAGHHLWLGGVEERAPQTGHRRPHGQRHDLGRGRIPARQQDRRRRHVVGTGRGGVDGRRLRRLDRSAGRRPLEADPLAPLDRQHRRARVRLLQADVQLLRPLGRLTRALEVGVELRGTAGSLLANCCGVADFSATLRSRAVSYTSAKRPIDAATSVASAAPFFSRGGRRSRSVVSCRDRLRRGLQGCVEHERGGFHSRHGPRAGCARGRARRRGRRAPRPASRPARSRSARPRRWVTAACAPRPPVRWRAGPCPGPRRCWQVR